ncbi:hypothetical protein KGF42_17095 [Clostridioides sp. ZZV15-6383]|uniref:hypothetical protein n=1 Tax=unclassified Clostridioides TaxID=2635829 RepID=UPI001D11A163|nr:hypothetical protein [Clostridioides sp. ZZV14-6345]MCC0701070.1 hypothetical protein [Clostridioides sp. ZZV15-6383]
MFAFSTIVLIVFLAYFVYSRSKFKNKSNAGAFFFENDSLVLNTGIPYSIPLDEIECVELEYSSWGLEHQLSYYLAVKVIKKDGKTKQVYYKGYKTAKLALPSDMKAALEEKKVRCVMIDIDK